MPLGCRHPSSVRRHLHKRVLLYFASRRSVLPDQKISPSTSRLPSDASAVHHLSRAQLHLASRRSVLTVRKLSPSTSRVCRRESDTARRCCLLLALLPQLVSAIRVLPCDCVLTSVPRQPAACLFYVSFLIINLENWTLFILLLNLTRTRHIWGLVLFFLQFVRFTGLCFTTTLYIFTFATLPLITFDGL